MERGAWQAIVPGVAESDMTEWLTIITSRYISKIIESRI